MAKSQQEEALAAAMVAGEVAAVREWLATNPTLEKLTLRGPDDYGWSPLQLAAFAQTNYRGTAEVTALLVHASSQPQQAEALAFFASEDKYLAQARALLDAGVTADVARKEGGTALQLAAGNGNPKMVQLLLKRGANPNTEGPHGSALRCASSSPLLVAMMSAAAANQPFCLFALHDLEKLRVSLEAKARDVRAFLLANPTEVFFAVAFEGSRTKANSERHFEAALARGREDFPDAYREPAKVERLRYNPGDFGFVVPAAPTASVPPLDFACLVQRGPDDDRTVRDLVVETFELNRAAVLAGVKVPADFRFLAAKHVA